MIRFLKHFMGKQRKKELEEWLLAKYEPAIKCYNDSERFDALSHLLIDLGETYMGIRYTEKVKEDLGISEKDFNSISRDVYEKLVNGYTDSDEDLDFPLFMRY